MPITQFVITGYATSSTSLVSQFLIPGDAPVEIEEIYIANFTGAAPPGGWAYSLQMYRNGELVINIGSTMAMGSTWNAGSLAVSPIPYNVGDELLLVMTASSGTWDMAEVHIYTHDALTLTGLEIAEQWNSPE